MNRSVAKFEDALKHNADAYRKARHPVDEASGRLVRALAAWKSPLWIRE